MGVRVTGPAPRWLLMTTVLCMVAAGLLGLGTLGIRAEQEDDSLKIRWALEMYQHR